MDLLELAKKGYDYAVRLKYEADLKIRKKKFYREIDDYSLNKEERDEEIILSLASYPARFDNLHLVLGSLFKQTVKPDRIILNVYQGHINDNIPYTVQMLQEKGLEICKREIDYKPHNKYLYTLKENPNAIIITVDDDFIYSERLIEELVRTHNRFPNCVIAGRGHKILFKNGEPKQYKDWVFEYDNPYYPSNCFLATGCGGILYPPHSLNEQVFDTDILKELCINQDDLWLKIMELLNGTKVVLCNKIIWKLSKVLQEEQCTALANSNVEEGRNDDAWKKLIQHYGITEKDFK